MINSWLWVGVSIVVLILIYCSNRIAYRHGIWDGAFNHFLPVVQQEMLFYDKHRATFLLKQEGLLDE